MFYFTDKNGERIKYDNSRIIGLHTNIATPSFEEVTETTDTGRVIVLERHLQSRSIEVVFLLKGEDFDDTYLLRDELYRLLAHDDLYLHETQLPYKRWKVSLQGEQMAEKGYTYATYSLQFIAHSGLAESVASTLDKRLFSENKFQFGQGLTWDNTDSYIHDTNRFNINNIGDVTITPLDMPLKISVLGATRNLQIVNHTTNEQWTYNGATTANDTIKLDGIYSYKNDINIFRDTNKQLITLAKGQNDIEIIGATNKVMTTFDSRFYYY